MLRSIDSQRKLLTRDSIFIAPYNKSTLPGGAVKFISPVGNQMNQIAITRSTHHFARVIFAYLAKHSQCLAETTIASIEECNVYVITVTGSTLILTYPFSDFLFLIASYFSL